MNRNKFGLPYIFDYVKGQDQRRLDNLDYMVKNCPNDFKKIWTSKRKELKEQIEKRRHKTLN
tara:strand:+ start:312 stop:497 length:186 start_codon:yes stop_codon:yes gene_type:complete